MASDLAAGKHTKTIPRIAIVSLYVVVWSCSYLTVPIVNALLYLPWSGSPDNSTRDIGTIAFVLISSSDDVLIPNSAGLEEPVNQTLVITVSSWIANDPLSESYIVHHGQEVPIRLVDNTDKHRSHSDNVSVTFHYWPIACAMYLEDVTAQVRGDGNLLSHSFNNSQAGNLQPFVRALPSSPYEKAWGQLFDAMWHREILPTFGAPGFEGEYLPQYWLERQLFQLLNGTTSTSSEKMLALEATLQSITSVAFSLLVQQLHVKRNLTSPEADVQGQQQTTLAKLHVNGLQTVTGLFCVAILFACVLYGTRRDGPILTRNCYIIVGDALDLMCLMRGSSLPGLITKPKNDTSTSEMKREKAEKIDVA